MSSVHCLYAFFQSSNFFPPSLSLSLSRSLSPSFSLISLSFSFSLCLSFTLPYLSDKSHNAFWGCLRHNEHLSKHANLCGLLPNGLGHMGEKRGDPREREKERIRKRGRQRERERKRRMIEKRAYSHSTQWPVSTAFRTDPLPQQVLQPSPWKHSSSL